MLISLFDCHAQIDTEFWFAPPDITSGHGDRPVYLRVASQDKPAIVRVIQPARGNAELANVSIAAHTAYTIDLTGYVGFMETNLPDSVMKTGLKITSTAPITAYYEEGSALNAEIFVLKGRNGLGNRFILPWQNVYNNSGDYSPIPFASFDVVATRNNTVVTVIPTKPIYGHASDSVIVVKLNAGETYSFRKVSLLGEANPAGTIITSTKPIAVTIKDDSVIKSTCRDVLGEQVVPVKVAGTEYIVPQGFLDFPEYLFVTATENDTKLFFSGSNVPAVTLNRGQNFRLQINLRSTYVVATKKVYVLHVTGFGCEVGMASLPTITCTGSKEISFTRSTSEFFGMNVLVKKEGIFDFKLNGQGALISADKFVAVPGTGNRWYSAQLSYSVDQVPVGQASVISNDHYSFQAGIINGNAGTTSRYGYFSSYSTLFIGDDQAICEGESTTLDAGPGKESYLWSTGATSQTIEVSMTGDYWVKVTREDCVLSDTIHIDVSKGEIDLGPDVGLCLGDTARIDGKENFSWQWSDGSTGRYLRTTELGKYWVSVLDNIGCPSSDTIEVKRYTHEFDAGVQATLEYVSVDTTEENKVHLAWAITESERKKENEIHVYKRVLGASDWKLASTLPADISSFTEEGNSTDDDSYEYYLGLANQCGEVQLESKVHNTIHLTANADEAKGVINFGWNKYQGWDAGAGRYELWRRLDDVPGYHFVAAINGNEDSYAPMIAGDGFVHTYVLRAVETHRTDESWSNNIELVFEHPVRVPNVFTPNDDGLNQFFHIANVELYPESRLLVIDRWGKEVFEASGYKNNWDGKGVNTGVYYYVLDLKRNDEVIKGVVSILR